MNDPVFQAVTWYRLTLALYLSADDPAAFAVLYASASPRLEELAGLDDPLEHIRELHRGGAWLPAVTRAHVDGGPRDVAVSRRERLLAGTPNGTGILLMANALAGVEPEAWRAWFARLSPEQLRAVGVEADPQYEAADLCPRCGTVVLLGSESYRIRCGLCHSPTIDTPRRPVSSVTVGAL